MSAPKKEAPYPLGNFVAEAVFVDDADDDKGDDDEPPVLSVLLSALSNRQSSPARPLLLLLLWWFPVVCDCPMGVGTRRSGRDDNEPVSTTSSSSSMTTFSRFVGESTRGGMMWCVGWGVLLG